MIDVQAQLDRASTLYQKRKQEIATIRNTRHKKVGMVFLEMTEHEKEQKISQVQKNYGGQIRDIYKEINAHRVAEGQPPLDNPF